MFLDDNAPDPVNGKSVSVWIGYLQGKRAIIYLFVRVHEPVGSEPYAVSLHSINSY